MHDLCESCHQRLAVFACSVVGCDELPDGECDDFNIKLCALCTKEEEAHIFYELASEPHRYLASREAALLLSSYLGR